TFGTAKADEEAIGKAVEQVFDLTPASIIEALDLKRPIYERTAAHGHFGRDEFSWEQTNRVAQLKQAMGAAVSG
ncbi:MAG: methionine adenosyltransferase domain-containing protein, partial [Planctomycetota bacterium]